MASRMTGRRLAALSAVIAVLATTQVLVAPIAQAQQNFVPISGSGSTWSFNALDQWRRNVDTNYGIRVEFAANGSSQGRTEFATGQVDFAVSEIEYGLTDGGITEPPPAQPFAYMPIVAGGTALMYNLKIGNNRVTNLRLSGDVIAKIFSRQITNWSDQAIKDDNPGLTLPARDIVPVVRSDGSGTTAQFTRWMAARHGPVWDSYCGQSPCGFTSNYPVKAGVQAKNGSQGVATFVAQDSSEGSITYVEYSYARNANFPVAKVLNDGGFYVEPKATSVAVALTQAGIRDDLTQDLAPVYGYTDPRSYPLSSYSYMIIPTAAGGRFTAEKGRSLSEFTYYFLCEGQQQADALGYSPLPFNLVQAAVEQAGRIPGTTNKLSRNALQGCNNPTFTPDGTGNALAETAPQPDPCDQKGVAQCTVGTGGATQDTPNNGGGGVAAAGPGAGAGGGPATAGDDGAGGESASNTGAVAGGAADSSTAGIIGGTSGAIDPSTGLPTGTTIDPETGELISAQNGPGLASSVSAIPVSVNLPNDGQRIILVVASVLLLVALILGPPLISRALLNRRGGTGSS